MIVPMKKVSLVVMDKDREESLDKLRKLGVLHLEKKSVSSETLTKLLEKRTRIETALALLRPYAEAQKKSKDSRNSPAAAPRRRKSDFKEEPYSKDSLDALIDQDPVTRILLLGEEKKSLQDELASTARERTRIEKWGSFDPKAFAELALKGVVLIPYELSHKSFGELDKEVRYIRLGADKTSVYILVLDKPIEGESPFTLPGHSLNEINNRTAEIGDELAENDKQLAGLLSALPSIKADAALLAEQIEFETARAGMIVVEDDEEKEREYPFELFTVSWLSGFIPARDLGVLKRGAAENGWAFIADDPGPDDDVPTQLKNNRLVSLIYPLTEFLEVTPGYSEVDISGWFLLFFTIFFGMIFGDAGYGAIILIAAITGIIKTARKGVPAVFKLLLLLGLSNFIWGILTCTWFAIDVNMLPAVLRNISLPLISNVTSGESAYGSDIVQQNLMIFCFSLALLQLSIGHIVAIFRNKTLKAIGDIGSIAMLVGMYFIVLALIASNAARQIPMQMWAVYLFGAGFVLNFIFASYDGSIGRSALESCKNIISVILGIANVFSDIMSYIRLWAVGLAGGAIASTVNAMAGPMVGHFVFFIFGVVLFGFGHGLNLVLNVLSVLVHGVRLNTLEFSGHAGLTWSGHAYKPFAKRIKSEMRSA